MKGPRNGVYSHGEGGADVSAQNPGKDEAMVKSMTDMTAGDPQPAGCHVEIKILADTEMSTNRPTMVKEEVGQDPEIIMYPQSCF